MKQDQKLFEIPSQIQLMCRTIDVVMETSLVYEQDRRGETRYLKNQIAIQASTEGYENPTDHQVEIYFHELLHWVFDMMERADLNEDEKLIEVMGRLLAQAALSAKYREEP